jgi:cysteine desulfurase
MKYYFDNCATTRVDDKVLEVMLPYFKEFYGNASSIYKLGQISKYKIEEARENISNILGCNPDEIYFTSGGSESNNLALKGIMEANKDKGKHLITSVIEHPSILNTCKYLESIGYDVTYINVDSNGIIDLEELKNSIRKDTVLVSIMSANNEIGTIEPIEEISKICKENNIILHTDAVQAIGNIKINLSDIDSLSLSSHKFYGPKGIGILYVKKGTLFNPIINGGHQEQNKRAGTENVPYIIGMSYALELIYSNLDEKNKYVSDLRDYFEKEIKKVIPCVIINGKNRLPGVSNITIPDIENDTLIIALDMRGIAISAGSACTSGSIETSHVLKSIGLSDKESKSTIRISFGKYNTKEEIDYLVSSIKEVVK